MTTKETLLKQVIELNKEGKYQVVDDLLTEEILKEYNDAVLYSEKIRALWKLKRYEDCEELVDLGYKLDQNNAKINNYLGNIYSKKNEYDKAEAYYKKAIELEPDYSMAHYNLGIFYNNRKDPKKAEKHYLRAVEIDPDYAFAHNNLGLIYYRKNEYDKAELHFQKTININSKISNPYYNLALLLFDKKEYEKSQENYQKYLYIQQKYLDTENLQSDYFIDSAKSRIEEIDNILESKQYEKITATISKIKEILCFKKGNLTHYTGITVAKFLIIDKTQFRLSEGAYLNDTSEGTILFDYLDFNTTTQNNCAPNATVFSKKPFIGSFVNQTKNNDLTLWRMYGKET